MRENTRCCHTVVLLTLLLAVTLLGACGNSNKKSTSPATTSVLSAATPTAGLNTCATCHTVVVADWITSRHANAAGGDLNSTGNPTGAQIAAGNCATCHDPLGDSQRLTAGVTGNTPRPVVGCESCHGGGSLHAAAGGTGPIGFATKVAGVIGTTSTVQVSAQFNTCTSCHELLSPTDPAGTTPATAVHDAGGSDPRVVSTVTTSNANSITNTHLATPGSWRTADGLNTHNTVTDFMAITGYAMDFAFEKVCSNCHNPHKNATINREWAGSAHADRQGIKMDPRSSTFVGTYSFSSAWAHYNWSESGRRACQRCHTTTGFTQYANALRDGNTQLALDIQHGLVTLVTYTPGFKPEMLECNGCHTDNRGTLRNPGPITANYDLISGSSVYALVSHAYPDVAGSNVCMACHTAREIGDTIHAINDPALLSSGTITSVNFSKRSFINSHYLTAGGTVFRVTGYTFSGRDYNNLSIYMHDKIGSTAAPNTGSNGPCIGCHMSRPNNNGNHLFLPVSRIASGGTVTITGIASEVCFKCHGPNDELMRDLVQTQRNLYAESLEALKDMLETRGYYFADASPYFYTLRDNKGTVSVSTGSPTVTVTGSDWAVSNVTGTTQPNTIQDRFRVDSDGQYYAVQSRDSATQITLQAPYAGPSNASMAYTIIGPSAQSWLTTTTPAYPSATIDTDTTGNTTGKNNMGAAFNFNLFEHDPGGYAHNRYYVKRLIYDSIDWLDDNQMNFSVGSTLNTICSSGSAPAWCAGAMEYLLPNGVMNGVAAERP